MDVDLADLLGIPDEPSFYRVEVTLKITAGPGDMTAADLWAALDQVGDELGRGGTIVAALSAQAVYEVVVPARHPLLAAYLAGELVARTVRGRRLEVTASRCTGRADAPVEALSIQVGDVPAGRAELPAPIDDLAESGTTVLAQAVALYRERLRHPVLVSS